MECAAMTYLILSKYLQLMTLLKARYHGCGNHLFTTDHLQNLLFTLYTHSFKYHHHRYVLQH